MSSSRPPGTMRRRCCWVALFMALWVLPACSSEPLAGRTAGVVFLTQDDCKAFVVQALTGSYALLTAATDNLTPERGDVFEGGVLRRGRVTFRYLPTKGNQDRREARQVILNVEESGLSVTDAQASLRAACSVPG
ncbi:MAG: hypothetical protein AAFN13_15185 [Bacteroidota bacterium]